MASESDSAVDAPPGANGSNEPCSLRSNEGEQSLIVEMRVLVRQMAETNIHLMVLADQTSKCLAHIAILLDLVFTDEDEADTESTTYLDGTPII